MIEIRKSGFLWAIPLLIAVFLISFPAYAKYSGGIGEPNDPYKIATAEELMLLGDSPEDYDKHFIMTADIDMDPNLPGRKVFDRAVIAQDVNDANRWFDGTQFTGVFDGNGYVISNLHINGSSYLGLFGKLGDGVDISNLGIEAVDVNGTGKFVGGLAGINGTLSWEIIELSNITNCYCTGTVSGDNHVGGLVSINDGGSIAVSYSSCTVTGDNHVGGLVGFNSSFGDVLDSYSTGAVTGDSCVGGLVAKSDGSVLSCHSIGTVIGGDHVGGLVGRLFHGDVSHCCSTSTVTGIRRFIGGLVGCNDGGSIATSYSSGAVSGGTSVSVGGLVGINSGGRITTSYNSGAVNGGTSVGGLVGANSKGYVTSCHSISAVSGKEKVGGFVGNNSGSVLNCFWNTETSGQIESDGGTGLTTAKMQDIQIYLDAGWDFWGERENGLHETWKISQVHGYPVLSIFHGFEPPTLSGDGTQDLPYLVSDANELAAVVYHNPNAFYRMTMDIDLSEISWSMSVIPQLSGSFDGNGHTISHLTIAGVGYLGLFGQLESGAEIKNLGVVDVNIIGSGNLVGGLVGSNGEGYLTACYSIGTVSGGDYVGGLVGSGYNSAMTACYSRGMVSGENSVGGLMGSNLEGDLIHCYSTSTVSGDRGVGGLVGNNGGSVIQSYSTGSVTGTTVGGLVGGNKIGWDSPAYGIATDCFWDTETSGQVTSAGGTGKTTAEMQTAGTFLEAGWDFVDETENGTEDIWWIDEGQDYPRLWWEPLNDY